MISHEVFIEFFLIFPCIIRNHLNLDTILSILICHIIADLSIGIPI